MQINRTLCEELAKELIRAAQAREPAEHGEWFYVGAGWFSRIYSHPSMPGLVIKVSGRAGFGDGGESKAENPADGWQLFAVYCMKNPCKWLPKILCFERVDEHHCWAVMPRYDSARSSYHDEKARIKAALGEYVDEDEPRYTIEPKWVRRLRDFVQRMELQREASVDLHNGNFMQYNGQLIVTDPLGSVRS